MSRKPHNPEVGIELLPSDPKDTRFRATLNHYPTPEGVNEHEPDSMALALWASDVWAMTASQPARFFRKGEDGLWRRKAEPAKEISVVGAVMIQNGRCFAARRAPHKSGAGQWEFPGGKSEAGETPKQTLARKLREKFGIVVKVGPFIARTECPFERTDDDALAVLDLYLVDWVDGAFSPTDHDSMGWFTPDEISGLHLASADYAALVPILAVIRASEFLTHTAQP